MQVTPANFSNTHGKPARPLGSGESVRTTGRRFSDQFDGSRRSAGKLGPNTAARAPDDSGALERGAHDENRLADDSCMRGGSGGATEVHAQIAVPVFVRAIGIAVRRVGRETYDQRDGRDKCDQTITAKTRAQEKGGIWRRNDKPSLRGASGATRVKIVDNERLVILTTRPTVCRAVSRPSLRHINSRETQP
jgi:hypothetical protein